jgi:hypothetical protein
VSDALASGFVIAKKKKERRKTKNEQESVANLTNIAD